MPVVLPQFSKTSGDQNVMNSANAVVASIDNDSSNGFKKPTGN